MRLCVCTHVSVLFIFFSSLIAGGRQVGVSLATLSLALVVKATSVCYTDPKFSCHVLLILSTVAKEQRLTCSKEKTLKLDPEYMPKPIFLELTSFFIANT